MSRIFTLKNKQSKERRDYRTRRVWSLKQKLEILDLASATSALHASRTHDVDIRLVFQWRAHEKLGELEKRTWREPGRPKRRNRQHDEIDSADGDSWSDT